jgi:hypothetical protein
MNALCFLRTIGHGALFVILMCVANALADRVSQGLGPLDPDLIPKGLQPPAKLWGISHCRHDPHPAVGRLTYDLIPGQWGFKQMVSRFRAKKRSELYLLAMPEMRSAASYICIEVKIPRA